ncbi:WD40 repeat-containing protein [Heterostelium album PN500]|uniref:tRNA (guanine-N(7)-)-methyltransferase non-catalytic subunit n=1 Tax=Heterostelium pallidum (strain ATCC 26659 / Pp 5 / PN500) TaxID=670386 RepID=D3B6V4_HETP5|nr:WD40 repeat-containing protein [Heterostelium album PN500]EFA83074.1 WD40 repeat-containing protein [Heterostelium album PN500]|eukprot:XP_020435191.1 WD40 repeat-containing protein [Heterostelium album PN500]
MARTKQTVRKLAPAMKPKNNNKENNDNKENNVKKEKNNHYNDQTLIPYNFAKAPISTIQYSSVLNIVVFSVGDILYSFNLSSLNEIAQNESLNSVSFTHDSSAIITTASKVKTFTIWKKPQNINDKWIQSLQVSTKLKILSSVLPKDNKTIILTDKTGDVLSYKLDGPDNQDGTELLGHFSAITDTQFSPCYNYLLTSDRDEKIRVSNYPNTFDINNFCLGHTLFVSKFIFNPSKPEIIVSGSGDGTVKVWNWKSGEVLQSLDLKQAGQAVDEVITLPLAIVNNTLYLSIEGKSSLYCYKFNGETNNLEQLPTVDLPAQPLSYCVVVGSRLLVPTITSEESTPLLLAFDTATNSLDQAFVEKINTHSFAPVNNLQSFKFLMKIQYKKYLTLNKREKADSKDDGEDDEEQEDEPEVQEEVKEDEDSKDEKAIKLRKMTVEGAKEQTK